MTTEYTIPLAIRASLSIILEPDQSLTREIIDQAIDGFNSQWENHALNTDGPGTIYADCVGPLNNDWRGASLDKITGERGVFDLRTDTEKAENLDAVEDLLRELLEFQSDQFAPDGKPKDIDAWAKFIADWGRRARRALTAHN